MRYLYCILAITVMFLSCKKDNKEAGTVEFYLLKSYQPVAGKCQVDPNVSILEDSALVKNQDILAYFKVNTQFSISDNSMKKIKALPNRTPFAVVVDKQVIYYAILIPSYSSSSCDHSITIDYVIAGNNRLSMNLGYAGADPDIDDQRNSPKLIATLRQQGKLR